MALVTGGAGFIGSHLVEALLRDGVHVRVLDNLSTGTMRNLEGQEVDFIPGDIRDREAVARAIAGVQRVYHLAAMISVPGSMKDPLGCYETNLTGSLHVLEAARAAGVEGVVLASSAAVYGEADEAVDEEAPARPLSPYAASKLAMEQAGWLYATAFALPVVSLRFFNVYGPRQSPDSPYAAAIPTFIRAFLEGHPPTIFGDGEQRRDFVFVEDVVRAMVLACKTREAAGEVINIAGGEDISILRLAELIRGLIPGSPEPVFGPPRPGDIRFSLGEVGRAGRLLGFRPVFDLRRGLERTVAWFRAQDQR